MAKRTPQQTMAVRIALVADAQEISDRDGDDAIILARLSAKHDVSESTARAWLEHGGFVIPVRKGRPTVEQVLRHEGKLDTLALIRKRNAQKG